MCDIVLLLKQPRYFIYFCNQKMINAYASCVRYKKNLMRRSYNHRVSHLTKKSDIHFVKFYRIKFYKENYSIFEYTTKLRTRKIKEIAFIS